MKDRLSLMCALLVISLILGGVAAAAPGLTENNNADHAVQVAPHALPLSVAVLPFDSKDKLIGEQAAEVIMASLSADPGLQLVERARLDEILEEQSLSLSAAVQPREAVRVGWLAGAKVLVTGRSFVVDEQILLTGRVIGVETGRVFVVQERGSTNDALLPVLDKLARRIGQVIEEHGKALVAPEVSGDKDKLLEALAKQLKGKSLPTVVALIPEVHYGAPAVDPAAETEMIYWLKKSGFEVIDLGTREGKMQAWAQDYYDNTGSAALSSSSVLPEEVQVIIAGQAFSESGPRFGNLHSAKGRVEIRVLDRETSAVLAIARRTTGAIDLSERIAGKKALEEAAASIAYELIPQIAAIK